MISKQEKPRVEVRFPVFEDFTEEELEDEIVVEWEIVFDRKVHIRVRVEALENYLAMQYFLHRLRLSRATDIDEERKEFELTAKFKRIFLDSDHLMQALYRYCGQTAVDYLIFSRLEEEEKWRSLANEIKTMYLVA